MTEVYTGVVEWFAHQMGFIRWEKEGVRQKDMFVHYSDLNMDGFKTLYKDQSVSFEIGLNHKGQPKAVNVIVNK